MRATARLGLALVVSAVTGCSGSAGDGSGDGAVPGGEVLEDFADLAYREEVVVMPRAQTDSVTVEADRLMFPDDGSDFAASWRAGSVLLGDRRSGSEGNNAFGFMRRVTSVRHEAGHVVVETERATLDQVVVGAAAVSTDITAVEPVDLAGVDLSDYFADVPVGPGAANPGSQQTQSVPLGVSRERIEVRVDASATFAKQGSRVFLTLDKSAQLGDVPITVQFKGTGKMTWDFSFTPKLSLAFRTGITTGLESFEVAAEGAFHNQGDIDVEFDVSAASGTDPLELQGLDKLLEEGAMLGTPSEWQIAAAGPFVGPVIAGVPTTFRLELHADCSLGIQATVKAHAQAVADATSKLGIRYSKSAGWQPFSKFDFTPKASASLRVGGGISAECALTPRVAWLIADAVGPEIGVRGSVRVSGSYVETCDKQRSGAPDATGKLTVGAELQLQVGAKVNAWHIVDLDQGPYVVYAKSFPALYEDSKTIEQSGVGYCISDCQNGLSSGDETDTDCGGSCLPCADGDSCQVDGDCENGYCDPESERCQTPDLGSAGAGGGPATGGAGSAGTSGGATGGAGSGGTQSVGGSGGASGMGGSSPVGPTSNVKVTRALKRSAVQPASPWDALNPVGTSNDSTSFTVYDSRAVAHTMHIYFRKAANDTWDYHVLFDGGDLVGGSVGTPFEVSTGTLVFKATGALDSVVSFGVVVLDFTGAMAAQAIQLDFGDPVSAGGTGLAGTTQP